MLTKRMVWLLSATAGFTVANVYLNQTLLVSMADSFGVSATQIGMIATLSQIGYALGNLFLVPLGDLYERRRIILLLLAFVCVGLLASAMAQSFIWMVTASLFLGFVTIVPQIIVPLAASLAKANERGKILGNIAVGLVSGILCARLVSGFVDAQFGWRAVYWLSLGFTVLFIVLIRLGLPKNKESQNMSYKQLLLSLGPIFMKENVLKRVCLSQGMMFAAFSLFWTTLVFLLTSPPYSYGSGAVGTIGLVSIGGAFAAPVIGRFIDNRGAGLANMICMVIGLLSFIVAFAGGGFLPAVIASALLVTVGTQANQVACQAKLFQLSPEKRSRLNGLYMVSTFLGGALGSFVGVQAWSHFHWTGVCTAGLIMVAIALSSAIGSEKQMPVASH
ncbi:MFS transporter [Bacillus gobiensis]|uniref:MFS transporter n=1 Tax=Bacillus gobiensis TaxID=1441095 RepID=A0A0M3RAG8_9BACI|nr:MFS transporter [Bacillus gobiensis]ALC83162.1 MFS transporter [Bacillus gobiensis]